MCWIWLFLAIFLEVAATILMKLSNGLTRTLPTVGMFVLYGLSFIPVTIALKEMEIGAVYAIWSAVGTALVAVLGVVIFHEPTNALKVVSIALIIFGVVCLNLSSRLSPRAANRTQDQLRTELRLNDPAIDKTGSISAAAMATGSAQSTTER
jgi:small multidrug resistance pump